MSKKIKIPLTNIRWQLYDLFHEYLDEQYDLEKTRHYDKYDYMDDDEVLWAMQQGYVFPGLDDGCFYDDDDDDDPNLVWPIRKKGKKHTSDDDAYAEYWKNEEKKAKRKHRKKGKGARIIDISTPYSGDEGSPREYDDLDSDGINDGKLIYYYPNYRNKEDRLEFNTLKEFDDFCADYGYSVPPYIGEQIAYRRISHTCLNPMAREYGGFEIMAEESYADMMYEAVDVSDL